MPIQTLSKGYKKPVAPSTGDQFFPAMEENIQRMNDHVHDGTTGAITPNSTQNILKADWVSVSGGAGLYSQVVTLPTGRSYDTTDISFRLSTGEIVNPTVEKVDATSYRVYTNDNTKDYVAIYG